MTDAVIQRIRAVADPDSEMIAYRSRKLPERFVMLFARDMSPIVPANFFLIDRCWPLKKRRKGRWENTQAAYADDLAHWWAYLAWKGREWNDITIKDLEEYAGLLSEYVSPNTFRRLKARTIRRRVGTACDFYKWAWRNQYIAAPVFSTVPSDRTVSTILNDGVIPVSDGEELLPDGDLGDAAVKPLSKTTLRRVLETIGPSPYEMEPVNGFVRDRLVAEVAVITGMRESEVLSLSVMDLLGMEQKADVEDPWKEVTLRIRGKGGKLRLVYFPSALVFALARYYRSERAEVVAAAEARCTAEGRHYSPPTPLFLNGINSNPDSIGKPLRAETISARFTSAVKACGLVRQELGFELDPISGWPLVCPDTGAWVRKWTQIAEHTFHDLRHTFALNFYAAEEAQGNKAPWLKLKARLGHSRVATTMDIYLDHVGELDCEVSDGVISYYRNVIDA